MTTNGSSTSARGSARASLVAVLAIVALVATGVFGMVQAGADLASPVTITQTATPSPVESGDQLTYSIDIVNTGGSRADEVVFTDQIAGMTGLIITSNVGTCTQTEGLVRCEAGSLDGFQPWHITIRGEVEAPNGTTLFNTGSVTGTRSSQTFSAASTISTLVNTQASSPLPNLGISVAAPSTITP